MTTVELPPKVWTQIAEATGAIYVEHRNSGQAPYRITVASAPPVSSGDGEVFGSNERGDFATGPGKVYARPLNNEQARITFSVTVLRETASDAVTVEVPVGSSLVSAIFTNAPVLRPVTLVLEAGYVMGEQVIIDGLDLGHLTITAEDATVTIDGAAMVTETPGRSDGGPRKPAFAGLNGAVMPAIGALFSMSSAGSGSNRDGLFLYRSRGIVLPDCGITNAKGAGAYLVSSQLSAEKGVFSNALDRGVWARSASRVDFFDGVASGCGWTAFQLDGGSSGECGSANLTNSGHYGFRVRGGSQGGGRAADVSGSAGHGLNCNEGSSMEFRDGVALLCGITDGEPAVQATESSMINAFGADISGTFASGLVTARSGSVICAEEATVNFSSGSGVHYRALRGAIISGIDFAAGKTLSQPVNRYTGDGAILDVTQPTPFALSVPAASTLVIASGAITVTQSYHLVDTEASAATDTLDTINGGNEGDIVILRGAEAATRVVTVSNGTGNLRLPGGSVALNGVNDTVTMLKVGSNWIAISVKA